MGYIEKSLAGNEQILYRAHFPWLYRAAAWICLLAGLAAALALQPQQSAWVSAACAGVGLMLFLAIMLPIWSQRIAVTNQRLIHRRGLIRRSTEELQLSAVEEVRVEQGILGRIFGFGRVTVSGTGVEDVRLPVLGDPVKLRQMLQEGISLEGISWRRTDEPLRNARTA